MPPEPHGAARSGVPGWAGWLPDRLLPDLSAIVARPGFRSWAARFPLTRGVARRRAAALFDLCAGFVYTQILQASLEVRLYEVLAPGPLDAAAVADRTALPPAAARRLLDGCVALRLVARRRGGRYGLGPLGAALIGNPGVAAMVAHHRVLYADLADPVALLRGGPSQLSGYWAYRADAAPADVAAFSALMAASQPLVAGEILDAYSVARHRCLLDVGGGQGAFLAEAGRRAPDLRLMLFDLPAVADRARDSLAHAGLAPRAQVLPGDFRTDPIPQGADLISLIRVVHDHDDTDARHLLAAVRSALPAGGTLLLGEPMADTPGATRMGDAYFGFYLLAMGRGRPRSAAELTAMLHAAGFAQVRQLPTSTPLLASVLVARA